MLYIFRTKLEAFQSRSDIKYAKLLALHLLHHPASLEKRPKGFVGRFGHLFDDVDTLIVTSIHSKFKLGVIRKINGQLQPEVKNQLLDEVAKFTSYESVVEEVEEQDNDDDFFKVTIFANELIGLHRHRALHSNFNKNYMHFRICKPIHRLVLSQQPLLSTRLLMNRPIKNTNLLTKIPSQFISGKPGSKCF